MTSSACRWVLLSDQHLGVQGPGPGQPDLDGGLSELVDSVVEESGRTGTSAALVLLGDTFDLEHRQQTTRYGGTSTDRALRALQQLAGEHPVVIASLRRALENGVDVHVVPGNHDADLHRPPVWQALAALVRPPTGGGTLRLHPWVLHVPGLLLAEHGHRAHDINRPRHPTLPFRRHDPSRALEATPARALGAVRHARTRAALGDVVRAAGSAMVPSRPLPPEELRDLAASVALPERAVAELLRSPAVLPGLLARLVSTAVRAALRRPQPGYVAGAAQRTLDQLAASGVVVPYYVTGHTHRADVRTVRPAGATPAVQHLDAGTWSTLTRRGAGSSPLPTYVDVHVDADGGTAAELRTWTC